MEFGILLQASGWDYQNLAYFSDTITFLGIKKNRIIWQAKLLESESQMLLYMAKKTIYQIRDNASFKYFLPTIFLFLNCLWKLIYRLSILFRRNLLTHAVLEQLSRRPFLILLSLDLQFYFREGQMFLDNIQELNTVGCKGH